MSSPLQSTPLNQSLHLAGIHTLRGLAAIMVFLFHLHYVGHIPLPHSWHLIASHGGAGVQLFYVLSAFSLLHSNQKHVRSTDGTWIKSYLIKRFFRIAPLFYFMLVAHILLCIFKYQMTLDFQKIALNALFLFNFVPKEAEGIVWASWSIGVEMIFYLLLPIIMITVQSTKKAIMLCFLSILSSYVFRWVLEGDSNIPSGYAHYAFLSQFGVFCCGILGYWIYQTIKISNKAEQRKFVFLTWLLGPVLAFLLLTDIASIFVIRGRPDTLLWGLSFAFIAVLSVVAARPWMSHPALQYLGERSYSIYLTHAVLIGFGAKILNRVYEQCYPWLGGFSFGICALVVLVPILLVSELTYQLIEVKGIALGRSILNLKK